MSDDDSADIDVVDELEVTLQPKRSGFLTVLCILTWTWSALSIALLLFAFVAGQQNIQAMTKNLFNVWMLTGIFSPLLCVAGSLFMWHLNKIGFVLYLVGQLAPVILAFYLALVVKEIRGASLIFTIFGSVIPIGFIVMYAINLPGMKKIGSRSTNK